MKVRTNEMIMVCGSDPDCPLVKDITVIYAYVDDDGHTAYNKIKPGETLAHPGETFQKAIIDRVTAQVGTGNSVGANVLFGISCEKLPEECRVKATNHQLAYDAAFHRRLEDKFKWNNTHSKNEAMGLSVGGTEWYQHDRDHSLQELKDTLSECYQHLKSGISDRITNKQLRPRQKEAWKTLINWYFCSSPRNVRRFLLHAVMRFGKNFTLLEFVREVFEKKGVFNVLFVSGRPSVAASLYNDVKDDVKYDGWGFHHLTNLSMRITANPGKPTIYFASFQKLGSDDRRENDEELLFEELTEEQDKSVKEQLQNCMSEIEGIKFEFLVLDECHVFTQTSLSKKLIEKIDCKNHIYVSATPYKIMHEFAKGSFYRFTFLDYCEAVKKKEEGFENCPLPSIYLPKFDEEDLKWVKSCYKDGSFSLQELFSCHTSEAGHPEFDHVDAVKCWLDYIAKNVYNAHTLTGPLSRCRKDHSAWWVPNVNAASALAAQMKNHRFFKHYKMLLTTGEGANTVDISSVKSGIAHNDKTIAIMCAKFMEGTTISKWKLIINASPFQGIELYEQMLGRSFTADPLFPSEPAIMVDFDPQRHLTCVAGIIRENCSVHGQTTRDPRDGAKTLIECMPIYSLGNAHEINSQKHIEDIFEQFMKWNKGTRVTDLLDANSNVHLGNLMNASADIHEMIKRWNATAEKKKIDVEVSNNNIPKSKSQQNSSKKLTTSQRSFLDIMVRKIRPVLVRLPRAQWNSTFEEQKIKSLSDVCAFGRKKPEDFLDDLGISYDEFQALLNADILCGWEIDVILSQNAQAIWDNS